MISVIIPTLNEQQALTRLLPSLRGLEGVEIIVADGGSDDLSCDLAVAYADRVLRSPRGRGVQMNAGARCASGEILLFLHADSALPAGWPLLVARAMEDREVVGGAFDLRLQGDERRYRVIGAAASLRSRLLKTPYGDQGVFVRTELFRQMGGFRDIPIMEDADFARRLGRMGKTAFIAKPLTTSARKWRRHGFCRTTMAHWLVTAGFYAGIPPRYLESLYRTIISKP